jgi:oligopeptidase A
LKFSNNVLDSTKAFKLVLSDPKDVEGLPESAKALAAQQAIGAGHADATKDNGPWILTLDMPSYLPSMQHLKNRDIREKLYRAFVTRASVDEVNNAEIVKRTLQIKDETSKMLGYKCYAELSLASKMASSIDEVLQLINMLQEKSYPFAVKEMEDFEKYEVGRQWKTSQTLMRDYTALLKAFRRCS